MAREKQLVALLQEYGAMDGVKGAMIAGSDGAYGKAEASGLSQTMANDVARTVRRMTVASATVGAPVEELVISFGPARLLVAPLVDEAIFVALIDRDDALPAVRELLTSQRSDLRRVVGEGDDGQDLPETTVDEPEDEVDRLLGGELGPILNYIDARFTSFMEESGIMDRDKAKRTMRIQMREWLLCCSPSPYTFPLLLDALAQQLNDVPDTRAEFMNEVQEALHYSDIWSGKAAR